MNVKKSSNITMVDSICQDFDVAIPNKVYKLPNGIRDFRVLTPAFFNIHQEGIINIDNNRTHIIQYIATSDIGLNAHWH